MKTLTIAHTITQQTPPVAVPGPLLRTARGLAPTVSTALVRAFQPRPQAAHEHLRPLPPKQTYAALHVDGWLSRIAGIDHSSERRIEIELPLGTPQYVNATTLKRLLGARHSDRLFRRKGKTWTICANDIMIDLQDTATEYRVGEIAVYS